VGVNKQNILKAMEETLEKSGKLPENSPYGDGDAAERIDKIIESEIATSSL
jgi:UDP-N-acetylglucosamine 2-epimerase